MSKRQALPLKKNQIIPLDITGLTHEGSGVGRHQGVAVFVPMTAPGDRVAVKIVKVLSRHAFGIVQELLAPASCRRESGCGVYRQCGGCSLRHLSYQQELAEKHSWVQENLRRIGGLSLELEAILPSPRQDRYRNKAQYPVGLVDGRVVAGFYAKRSHRLVPVEDCPLQPDFFAEITGTVCAFLEEYGVPPYNEETGAGLVRHIFLRHAEATGQVMVCLVICGDSLPHWEILLDRLRACCPALATLVLNVNRANTNVVLGNRDIVLWGEGTITDILCGVKLRLSPRSFYQVNREGAQLLYRQALEYACPRPEEVLLDLYCGAGAIGLSMAGRVRQLVGVEIVPAAVEDARDNAAAGGVANARFLCGDAGEAADLLRREGLRPHIIVVDPPRKGLDEQSIRQCAAMGPERLVYISCNSATLARDLALFAQLGYGARAGRAVDLFPRTAHVESVVLLEAK